MRSHSRHGGTLCLLVLLCSTAAAPSHRHHAVPTAQARAALLSAQAKTVRDQAAQRLAALQASQDRAQAIALSAQARNAAARLRETETRAADTMSRIEALNARRTALQAELAHEAAMLAPMLPLIERLSLYPSETLLAASAQPANAPPADALSGLMLLHGLGSQLELRAEAIRARQFDLAQLTASLETQNQGLAVLRQEQAERGQAVAAQAEQAATVQRVSQDAADAAARQAAASASRAVTLQDAVGRIEAAQHSAEARFQREVAVADHARKPDVARTARKDAAAVSADAGPGLVPGAAGGAPVAGRQVQGWGAATDAGPATGITYASPAMALVTAPCNGRIDFAGPFRSYGQMLILDCGHGYRFVLAGLDRLDVAIGQKLAKGVAIGRMPDWLASSAGRPSLYVQLRHGSQAIDPGNFLRNPS